MALSECKSPTNQHQLQFEVWNKGSKTMIIESKFVQKYEMLTNVTILTALGDRIFFEEEYIKVLTNRNWMKTI